MRFVGIQKIASLAKARCALLAKWAFPALLFVLLVGFGITKMSGSSVGQYYRYFYGNAPDSHLVFGIPEQIRGDEWNTVTPLAVSQAANNYTLNNPDVGNGEDTSVLLNVAYHNWLIILRPWNIFFLLFPLANAFALQWWSMIFLLGVITYALVLKLCSGRYAIAALASSFLMLSPLVQWWYRDYLIMTVAFGFLGLLLAMLLAENKSGHWQKWQKIAVILGLGYTLAAFIFLEYPPFQIMTALSICLFYLGWLHGRGWFRKDHRKQLLMLAGYLGAAGAIGLGIMLLYYLQDHAAIEAVRHTAFPSARVIRSGQATLGTLAHLLASPFSAGLQRHTPAAITYWTNQSEASLCIQYSPLLTLPVIYAVWQACRRTKQVRWDFLLLIAGMASIYTYLFVPHITSLFKPLLFYQIPPNRMELGLGLLDFFILLLLAKYYAVRPMHRRYAAAIGLAIFGAFLWAGWYTQKTNPGYITNTWLLIGAALWMALALWFLLRSRAIMALSMLVIISAVSVFHVNPLYEGLSPLTDTPLSQAISGIAAQDPDKLWATTDFTLQEYPQANGARSLTGDYSYPQDAIWRQFDHAPSDRYIYNRSAHVLVQIGNSNGLKLIGTNTFIAQINPCSLLVAHLDIGYLLTTNPQSNACLTLRSKLVFPQLTTYIYEVHSS